MKASSALPLLPTLLINEARIYLRRLGTFIQKTAGSRKNVQSRT